MKRCSDCHKDKPVEEFGRDRSRKDGLNYRCKACNAKRSRRWNIQNPEKYNANRMRVYYNKRAG